MAESFVGEIRLFAGNFAPGGWALCNGQLLSIAENDTLFNLIGTTYGGDGQSTFALPDMRGRLPIHMGQGAGLPNAVIGQSGGAESVTLTATTIPLHTHSLSGSGAGASTTIPTGQLVAQPNKNMFRAGTAVAAFAAASILPAGGSQPHDNVQPFLCLNYIISLFGIFPSPN